MSTVPPHTAIGMPLSLRRPKRQPDPLLTADQSRSVSTPTLLSRLRNSTFSRSKASLLSSFAYETVRSRTPPTPYSPSTILPPCQPAFREQPMLEPEPKKDKWEERGFNLTREQRECLAGAVCLGVWDPITEEDGEPSWTSGLSLTIRNAQVESFTFKRLDYRTARDSRDERRRCSIFKRALTSHIVPPLVPLLASQTCSRSSEAGRYLHSSLPISGIHTISQSHPPFTGPTSKSEIGLRFPDPGSSST